MSKAVKVQTTDLQVLFRAWIHSKERAKAHLEGLGLSIKPSHLDEFGGRVRLTVSVPKDKVQEWMDKIEAKPAVDAVRIWP